MTTFDKRRYQMLTQVRDFGVAHGDLFPPDSTARSAFAIVTAEVERLDALKLTARAAMRAARAARRVEARTLLVDALVRAKNTARVLAKTIPQLATQVELPEGANARRIVDAADHGGSFREWTFCLLDDDSVFADMRNGRHARKYVLGRHRSHRAAESQRQL